MALVEKTHGRDKRDRLAARPDSGDPLFHFIDRFNDIHGNLLERVVNRRKITSFDLFDILFNSRRNSRGNISITFNKFG